MISSLGAMLKSAANLLLAGFSFHFPEKSVTWADTVIEIKRIVKKIITFFILQFIRGYSHKVLKKNELNKAESKGKYFDLEIFSKA
jgi:hypothetical protein